MLTHMGQGRYLVNNTHLVVGSTHTGDIALADIIYGAFINQTQSGVCVCVQDCDVIVVRLLAGYLVTEAKIR